MSAATDYLSAQLANTTDNPDDTLTLGVTLTLTQQPAQVGTPGITGYGTQIGTIVRNNGSPTGVVADHLAVQFSDRNDFRGPADDLAVSLRITGDSIRLDITNHSWGEGQTTATTTDLDPTKSGGNPAHSEPFPCLLLELSLLDRWDDVD